MDIPYTSEAQYSHCLSVSVTQYPYTQLMCAHAHTLLLAPCSETCRLASSGKLGKDHLLEFIMLWTSFWQLTDLENNQDTISKPFQWTVGCIISFIIMWMIAHMQFADRVLCLFPWILCLKRLKPHTQETILQSCDASLTALALAGTMRNPNRLVLATSHLMRIQILRNECDLCLGKSTVNSGYLWVRFHVRACLAIFAKCWRPHSVSRSWSER